MMLRLAWTFGLVSTRQYGARTNMSVTNPQAIQFLERTLFKDRLAIIVFLAGLIILAYTFLNAPLFRRLG